MADSICFEVSVHAHAIIACPNLIGCASLRNAASSVCPDGRSATAANLKSGVVVGVGIRALLGHWACSTWRDSDVVGSAYTPSAGLRTVLRTSLTSSINVVPANCAHALVTNQDLIVSAARHTVPKAVSSVARLASLNTAAGWVQLVARCANAYSVAIAMRERAIQGHTSPLDIPLVTLLTEWRAVIGCDSFIICFTHTVVS